MFTNKFISILLVFLLILPLGLATPIPIDKFNFLNLFQSSNPLAITSGNLDYLKTKCGTAGYYSIHQCGTYYCLDSNSGLCNDVDINCKNSQTIYSCLSVGGSPSTTPTSPALGSAYCMPNSNNLCTKSFIYNNALACDVDYITNCGSVGCSNGKCNAGIPTCNNPYVLYQNKCEIIACGIQGNNCPSDSDCINGGTPQAYCQKTVQNPVIVVTNPTPLPTTPPPTAGVQPPPNTITPPTCPYLSPLKCADNEDLVPSTDSSGCPTSQCVKKEGGSITPLTYIIAISSILIIVGIIWYFGFRKRK